MSQLSIVREINYRCEILNAAFNIKAASMVPGGLSLIHNASHCALAIFEAKETRLDMSHSSNPDVRSSLVQGAYQMLGDIGRLEKLIPKVPEYCSLLTNGSVWMHLKVTNYGESSYWIHSEPIRVVQTGLEEVDEAGIDRVVDAILFVLMTAKQLLELLKISHGNTKQENEFEDDLNNEEEDIDEDGHHFKRPRIAPDIPIRKQISSSSSVLCLPLTKFNLDRLTRKYSVGWPFEFDFMPPILPLKRAKQSDSDF